MNEELIRKVSRMTGLDLREISSYWWEYRQTGSAEEFLTWVAATYPREFVVPAARQLGKLENSFDGKPNDDDYRRMNEIDDWFISLGIMDTEKWIITPCPEAKTPKWFTGDLYEEVCKAAYEGSDDFTGLDELDEEE
ncbi:MAG: hypothetical protein ONB55_21890 [candidate division KSB1 bacterium]|nr:hypothetical protein [candidate division KSB1 bacterium]